MQEQENIDFGAQHFAGWQRGSAFNTSRQYERVNRSAFYANIKGEYREYMRRFVQDALWWYDGFVPYFHNADQGIFSTRIGQALVNGAARKVVGGRLFFKNKNKETPKKGADGKYIINDALAYISSEWADKVGFSREVKKAVVFAAAAGTSLLKLNKTNGTLVPQALRFDSFYPVVGFNKKLLEVVCFIRDFTKIMDHGDARRFENFFVVEHRFFGDYKRADGTLLQHVPLIQYEIRRSSGTITEGMTYDTAGQKYPIRELPHSARRELARAFSGITFEKPILLPFKDSLGAELVNWTDCVSALPELPFGESMLTGITAYLQSYDYYFSAFNTDMYVGRGRVLVPKYMQSGMAKEKNAYNNGLDSMLYTQVETPAGAGDKAAAPTPIQFALRSQEWTEIRTMLLQNIAMSLGMNLATIASFLSDAQGQRTAREISTEESETALFVEDKREIIEKPINRILKLVTLHEGFSDDVVVRWSEAGLTNIYLRTDMLSTAVQNNLVSRQKAAQMFSQDDDEYQQAEEWDRIRDDMSEGGNEDAFSIFDTGDSDPEGGGAPTGFGTGQLPFGEGLEGDAEGGGEDHRGGNA